MSFTATIIPGKVFEEGEAVNISTLNQLGSPTVDIQGTVDSLILGTGAVSDTNVASDADIATSKLALNSIIKIDGSNVGINCDPLRTFHVAASELPAIGISVLDSTITDGQNIGSIYFGGSEDGGSLWDHGAAIVAYAAEDWVVGSNAGSDLTFHTIPVTTSNSVERVRIKDDGRFGLNQVNPVKSFDCVGGGVIKGRANYTLTGAIDPAANKIVTGVGTKFTEELVIGDGILVSGEERTVTAIEDDLELTVDAAFSDNANDSTPDCHPAAFTVLKDTGSPQFCCDTNGNASFENVPDAVVIKGSDTTPRLRITNSDSSSIELGQSGTVDAVLSNLADGAFIFGTDDESQMIIDKDGSVGIGLGSTVTEVPGSFKQYVQAEQNVLAIHVNNNTGSASTYFSAVTFKKRQYDTTDDIVEPGYINVRDSGVLYGSLSDYRLKENDTPIADGIDRLKLLRPIKFNFKSEPSNVVDGFFAHEVSEVCPNAVYREKDEVDEEGEIVPQGLDASKLVPLLTAALKETLAKVESLEARVAQLEGS